MTRLRGGHFVLFAFAAFFFLYAPVPILRFLAAFSAILPLAAYAYRLVVPSLIVVTRDEAVVRGVKRQDIEVRLSVRNRSFLALPYLTITDDKGELFGGMRNKVVGLEAYETTRLTYVVRGHERGSFPIGPVTVEGSDPLELFSFKRTFDVIGTVLVYPTIHPLDLAYRRGLPSGSLNVSNKLYEDVTQFRSLREYAPGDDMKRINWKASAKTSKLFTMEFDATLYFPVLVVLNFSREDYPTRHRATILERAAEYAASVPFFYAGLRQAIGFVSSGVLGENQQPTTVSVKAGYEHARSILESIANLKPAAGRANLSALLYESGVPLQVGTKVVIVSPPLRADQAEVLIAAKRKGLNLLLLRIDPETDRVVDDELGGAIPVVPVGRPKGEVLRG